MSECWNQWLRTPAVPRPPSRSPSCGSESRPTPGRRKPEGQCRSNGSDSGERKHAPVECKTCCAHCLGHELFKKPHCGHSERESGNCPQSGKHQTFCQELRDQPSTSSAQSRAHRDFPSARLASRQQQVCQVDTGNQQQRRRRPEQHNQRWPGFARHFFAQRDHGHRVRPAEVLRRYLQAQGGHGLPCLFQSDSWLEACHDLSIVPGEIHSQAGRKRRWHPHVDVVRRHEVKGLWHDADHFISLVVYRDLASDDVRCAAEAALPQPVTHHHHAHALVVLILGENASKRRLHTKNAPQIPRHLPRPDLFRFPVARQNGAARLAAREIGEYGVETAPLGPFSGS